MANQNYTNLLDEFHQSAMKVGLEYMLIGGFAASYWGTPRFTADIDYVISMDSLEKVKQVISTLGYELAFLHPKKSFAHFVKKELSGFRIDFMLVDDETWQKLKQGCSQVDLGGTVNYPIVGPKQLIAMKLHAAKQIDRSDSYKDLNDIAEILIEQNLSFDDREISDILKKYGTEKTISQLREILESKRSR